MKTSAPTLLPVMVTSICALSGCEWIAGIENTTVGMDAMPPADAALPGDGGPDDASPRDVCPAPCAGDAYGDFSNEQGGTSGQWRYVEVQPEQPDSPYVDMTFTIFPGPTVGWIGTGLVEPSMALCNAPRSEPPCLEMEKVLALTTPGDTADAHHPALLWIAPADGRYLVTCEGRVSSVAPAAPTTIQLTRNSHSEVLYEEAPTLTITPYEFNVEVDAVTGDPIVLSVTATTSEAVTVGVNFFVTGPMIP
jgi:hypothetical protein